MDLKDTVLTHNRWSTIFRAVMQGTFNDRGGEAVTEFVMDDKLGDSDPSTGENLARTHFKHPRFMADDFQPDPDDETSGGLLLDTKCWIRVADYFQTAGTWLLDLEGHVRQPPEDMPC